MASQLHRRQVLLFLAAVLLPCAALVGLGLRLVFQERELGAAREAQERRRITQQLRQELVSHLERAVLRQVTALAVRPGLLEAREYGDATVALVARLSGGTIVLPWEHDQRPADSRRLLNRGLFAAKVRRAEAAEFVNARPAQAADLLRAAGRAAEHPVQIAAARLSRARALAKAGRGADALAEYRGVAAASSDLVDEHGIPIALYAASRLLKHGSEHAAAMECVRRALAAERWLPPPALYLLRDLAAGLRDGSSQPGFRDEAAGIFQQVSGELSRTEQALALKTDFPGLGLVPIQNPAARQASG